MCILGTGGGTMLAGGGGPGQEVSHGFQGKGFASPLSLSHLTLLPTTLLLLSASLTVGNEAGGNGDAAQIHLHLTGSFHNELEITGRSAPSYLAPRMFWPVAFKPNRFDAPWPGQVRPNS